jgi:alkanesulfonate monooxygenase SsuD/methylene tetrahydromethanopterin reductase-like flavin-dependent oxidoreductase (luciferase family)
MDIGIGLPNAVMGVDRAGIVDWAREAEAAGFTTLGTLDRVAYGNYESLIALAAAAAVTERIRLMTDILIAPLRTNTALLAKQAATIDNLSEGRLVLGVAVGGRRDDFELSGADFAGRGRVFDRQLAELEELWAGETVGPPPANGRRPRVLIGGSNDSTFRRVAEHADGWTMGGAPPEALRDSLPTLREAWTAAGREGEPSTVALFYFALGDDAERAARESLGHYYAYLGDYAERVVQGAATDEEAVQSTLAAFEEAGADEVICFPASPDPRQVELLKLAVEGIA